MWKEKRRMGDLRSKSTHMALMLCSGSRGISRILVLDCMTSWLAVETVLPVMR